MDHHAAISILQRVAARKPKRAEFLIQAIRHRHSLFATAVALAPSFDPETLDNALSAVAESWPDKYCLRYHNELPQNTVSLRRTATTVTRKSFCFLETMREHPLFDENYAVIGCNYAARLREDGRNAEAHTIALKVVGHFVQRDKPMLPVEQRRYATALFTLGVTAEAQGLHRDAARTNKKTVSIYRGLPAALHSKHQSDLANALNNLAGNLFGLGEHHAALDNVQEAIVIFRKQDLRDLIDRYRLASALGVEANILVALGRHAEALPAAQEAEQVFGVLHEDRPIQFKPQWAQALTNLAMVHQRLSQPAQAAQWMEIAAETFNALLAIHPAAFRFEHARVHEGLAAARFNIGDYAAAITAAQVALEDYLHLAMADPARFSDNLVQGLRALLTYFARQAANGSQDFLSDTLRGIVAQTDEASRPMLLDAVEQLKRAPAEPDQTLASTNGTGDGGRHDT